MNAYHLPYLLLFRGCIIVRCVCFFLIFLLIINRESHGVVFISTNEKRLQNQVFIDKSKTNLWIHRDLARVHRLKGLTSPYIISYLNYLKVNILTLTFVVSEAGFGLTRIMFALFFACQIYTHAC